MPKPIKTVLEKVSQARANHRERHTSTGFGFAFADSIGYLDAGQWDSVTGSASVLLSRRYLTALESASPDNVTMRYALIFEGRKAVAAVVVQVVRISGSRVAGALEPKESSAKTKLGKVIQKATAKLRSATVSRLSTRLMVCGNLLCWGQHGVAFADDVAVESLWPAVAEALYRIRRAERLTGQTDFVMIKDFTEEEFGATNCLSRYSYQPVETDPNMVLEIPESWRSFDDYLGSLAKKYRKTATQIISDVTDGGCAVERLTDVGSERERVFALYQQVQARAAVRPVSIHPDYIPALAAAFGDDFRCTVLRRGNDLLGFVTTLRDREKAIGYYIGFDSAANAELPVYFRLMYAVIADAIDMGCRHVSYGRTALEPKARLGAKPVPLHLWMRHRVPVANVLMKGLLNAVHHEEAPDRNPFK